MKDDTLPICSACGRRHRVSLTVQPSKFRRSDPPLILCVQCWCDPESLNARAS